MGNILEQFVWGQSTDGYVDELAWRDRDTNGDGTLDERLYAMQDANFSVAVIGDSEVGNPVERYAYAAYGARTVLNSSYIPQAASAYDWFIGHQGLQHDVESTGLIYNRYRFRHPLLGMFLQRDPAEYMSFLNLYELEDSNPSNCTDPYGLQVGAIGGAAAFCAVNPEICALILLGVVVGLFILWLAGVTLAEVLSYEMRRRRYRPRPRNPHPELCSRQMCDDSALCGDDWNRICLIVPGCGCGCRGGAPIG